MSDLGNKEVFAKNLKYYMNLYKKSRNDIVDALGFSYTTFTSWETGVNYPRIDKIEMLANYFNISKADLIEDKYKDNSTPPRVKGVRIPILGRVVAGIPLEAIEDIEGYEEITPAMAAKGEYFALHVKGDSMTPSLRDGDTVIVRKQDYIESGETAIVLVNGDEATVKRVKYQENGVILIGENPTVYPPHFYTKEEIESLPVRIIGKVVESRRDWE